VAIDGNLALIGADVDDDNGENSGSAYLFLLGDAGWSQSAKLVASDGAPFDYFGISVALDGNRALIGAGGDDDNGPDAGAAYLFEGFTEVPGVAELIAPEDGALVGADFVLFVWQDGAFFWRVSAGNPAGWGPSSTPWWFFVEITHVGNPEETPGVPRLDQNYPNPFNPVTTIRYSIAMTAHVELTIFDVLGREVATLVNETMNPGSYEAHWDATRHPSGMYWYTLKAGGFVETRKLVLLR
jgi:hypothetical protein